ncbi:hypothetical protein GGX14DRAFT_621283 [Mycena pura]|uniref:Uncharacterized protein n=1 Tax=Mycena pura TaxID=153505 RepID=A0AAD6VG63_9AGAR|nr:hypothetical protein GGX14DRAFT_621283 [Mycena pura]
MHFLKVAVLALLPLAGTVLGAPSRRQNKGTIFAPAEGTNIKPGEVFGFQYQSVADFGVSSYNYTVFLLTSAPTTFNPSTDWGRGYYFGRFAEPNFPGNPSPKNPPPPTLTMPDFSKNPGGFGVGEVDVNGQFTLVVMEEYATGDGVVGNRLALSMNRIIYNSTS